MTPSGTSMPRSRCARSTAIHNWRSSTTFDWGDHSAVIASLAYREARTLGICTTRVYGD
ncbi:Uncharacterised protein [Mycobacteroides abscessus subsp. abscessus]|nr:Uncharacterised protein [Mycobacteroides abscessus subsp. abscessus]